ncbi:unnamed protein product, partial [Timema podura]|nr:unnamed protein product [Timema podura]
ASHPQRKQTATRKHSSVLEPLVVHSEESPTRPIKRARVGAPPPTPPFTSSPHNSPALRLMPSSPAHPENLRDNAVVLTKPKQEPIKEVGLTRPKQEPTEYDSDIEEVTLDEKMLRGHDPLMNVSLDQTLQRGDEHPLMSLLGGGSSQQQDPMAALPLFGISHDTGGSQDGGQDVNPCMHMSLKVKQRQVIILLRMRYYILLTSEHLGTNGLCSLGDIEKH